MKMKFLSVLALCMAMALGATAQTTTDGRKVKRITFDCETVNIEYADGTTEEGVEEATVKKGGETTSVKTVKTATAKAQRRWYTTDGRALPGEPREKGVYIVVEKNGVKKTIKK